MDRDPLILVSLKLGGLAAEQRLRLWQRVVSLSVDAQGANQFSWDPTPARRRPRQREAVELAASTAPSGSQLSALEHLAPLVAAVGPIVLSLNLYADDLWIAGISDWGDNLDVLFTPVTWRILEKDTIDLGVPYDIAEVPERPRWRAS